MRKNIIYALLMVLTGMLGCVEHEMVSSNTNHRKETETTPKLHKGNTRKSVPRPVLSPNQLVVRYAPQASNAYKAALRTQNHVTSFEAYACGSFDMELWTINTLAINVEGVVDNLERPENDSNVEGDRQFTFSIIHSTLLPAGPATGMWPKVRTYDEGAVNIAIIDTGFDYNLFDAPVLRETIGEVPCLADTAGYDFVHDNADIMDDHGHGTDVAKLIATELDSLGVSYQIIPVKAFDSSGQGTYWDIVRSMAYVACLSNVDIVNLSFGWYVLENQLILEDIMDYLATNSLIFSSAGNHGVNTDTGGKAHFPSGYPTGNMLAVGGYSAPYGVSPEALDEVIRLNPSSNYGEFNIDLAAPFDGYCLRYQTGSSHETVRRPQGTSFACAYATARAGMLYRPTLTANELKELVLGAAFQAEPLRHKIRDRQLLLRGYP